MLPSRFIGIALCMIVIGATSLSAGESHPTQKLPEVAFSTGGFGEGGGSGFGAPAFYGSYTLSVHKDQILTMRGVYMTEFNLVGLGSRLPQQKSWDLGVLYGIRTHHRGVFLGTAAIGLAVVSHVRRGAYLGHSSDMFFSDTYYEKKSSTTIGVPIELNAILSVWQSLGVGLTGFADVNPKSSFAGLTLSLFFGQLR